MKPNPLARFLSPHQFLTLQRWERIGSLLLNILVYTLLVLYLLPMVFMAASALMENRQFSDPNAPIYPARQVTFEYEGKARLVYNVPLESGVRQLALVKPGRTSSQFIDPANPAAGLITWQGYWRQLKGDYQFHLSWESFSLLFRTLRLVNLVKNSLLMALITEVGVLVSSIVVAYGFARFPLPGGDFLFYVLIATILIPDKVTLIPSYFMYTQVLHWLGTWYPLLLPFFFGSAVYIFLLRQNFRSIPRDLDEAAMLDGAGPLRILVSVILPQSWPVVITVSLLHFFYIWNETRQAALYLGIRPDLAPVSFGIQNFQSVSPIQNSLQASALVIMIVPVLVLLLSQRFFMQNMIITGTER